MVNELRSESLPYRGTPANPRYESGQSRSCQDFLSTLFRSLDENQVRYCVLHSWESLPRELPSDLDIAVHPEDAARLTSAFRDVQKLGYRLVQRIHYFVDAYCFRFVWREESRLKCVAVDVMFQRQRTAPIEASAEWLVSGRRRNGEFWIPEPATEFIYLLARRTWKATVRENHQQRLQQLVNTLGRPMAEKLAGTIFTAKLRGQVVEACAAKNLPELLPQMRRHARRANLGRNPVRLITQSFWNVVRLLGRWSEPTGVFLVLLGPDGSGKSTLIEHLISELGSVLDRQLLFHWRPMLLWRRKPEVDTTRPHGLPSHGLCRSIIRIFAHLIDYWLGYWLLIRPVLARNGLVVFDRYFDDVLVDASRYRYGGPLWLARLLRSFIPQPDLVLVLDAAEDTVLSRKQEVSRTEIRRQRRLYAKCAERKGHGQVINTAMPIPQVIEDASETVVNYLRQRCERRRGGCPTSRYAETTA